MMSQDEPEIAPLTPISAVSSSATFMYRLPLLETADSAIAPHSLSEQCWYCLSVSMNLILIKFILTKHL